MVFTCLGHVNIAHYAYSYRPQHCISANRWPDSLDLYRQADPRAVQVGEAAACLNSPARDRHTTCSTLCVPLHGCNVVPSDHTATAGPVQYQGRVSTWWIIWNTTLYTTTILHSSLARDFHHHKSESLTAIPWQKDMAPLSLRWFQLTSSVLSVLLTTAGTHELVFATPGQCSCELSQRLQTQPEVI